MSNEYRHMADAGPFNQRNDEHQDMTIAFEGVPSGLFGPSREPDAKRLGLSLCAASALLTIALTVVALL